MPLNFSAPDLTELTPRISVIGVGGAGGNAVNNMIDAQLEGVEFIVANTDAQAVGLAKASHKIQLGAGTTKGLGAGSIPDVGRQAAEESLEELMALLDGSNMLFITAGMGGGTGTGAAPVIAKAARERGILTVGVVTKPFQFEGARRMRTAEAGIEELQDKVDTLLIIPNQNLFRLADENTTFADAFAMADQVLHQGVRGITDLMIVPGLINLDFADVRSVMSEMGKAMMGTGEASGAERASQAAAAAISNPLLDETSMKGAKGVLINITGGLDMKLFEVDEAANRVRAEVDPDANIIVGSTFSQELEGTMRVSVVATGIERAEEISRPVIARTVRAEEKKPVEAEAPAPVAAPTPAPVAAEKVEEKTMIELADAAPIIEPTLPEIVAPAAQKVEVSVSAPAAAQPKPQAPMTSVPMAAKEPPKPQKPVARRELTPDDVSRRAENPVGDVHERIRRMLTEDDTVTLRPSQPPRQPQANPFRKTGASTIGTALNALKETFVAKTGHADEQPPRRKMAKDAFATDDEEDLEIPAFLRRSGR
ncbi:cell division protein FtsZ [Parvularcula marina]|uniref:cell division protein FtsZ n=1 Tax=Parvularcula marina TaxID=2292771 RepID=UPI0035192EED